MKEKKDYTYFEFLSRLDEIFPLPTEFDYKTTTAVEIGAKVKKMLDDFGYFDRVSIDEVIGYDNVDDYLDEIYGYGDDFDEEYDLINLKMHSIDNFDIKKFFSFEYDINVFSKFFNLHINKPDATQLDIFDAVYNMRLYFVEDYMKCDPSFHVMYSDSEIMKGYTEKYGSIEYLEELTRPENIENFVIKIMSIRDCGTIITDRADIRAGNDIVSVAPYLPITRYLLSHYGMDDNEGWRDEEPDAYGNLPMDVFEELRELTNEYFDKFIEFKKTNPTDEQLVEFARENTKEIVSFMVDITSIALTFRRRKEKSKSKQKNVSSDVDNKPIGIIEKYSNLMDLIKEQENIMSQLKELEEKRKQLESQFEKNDADIRKGGFDGK